MSKLTKTKARKPAPKRVDCLAWLIARNCDGMIMPVIPQERKSDLANAFNSYVPGCVRLVRVRVKEVGA